MFSDDSQASNLNAVIVGLDRLADDSSSLSPDEAESLIMCALTLLLREQGFTVHASTRGQDNGIDLVAVRPPDATAAQVSIGVEYKHWAAPVGTEVVRQLLGNAVLGNFDRVMLVSRSSFTGAAREMVSRELPIAIELLDPRSLQSWIAGLERTDPRGSPVLRAITDLSRRLASFIASDPRSLWEIEWRDMERVLAAVFEGIGFSVELTPGSKDQGKDLVLRCRVAGEQRSYIVEVKHWRSGKKVGSKYISDFVRVVAREQHKGGVFVSSSGYTDDVEALTEVERQGVRLSGEGKIIALCRTYEKRASGLWSAPEALPEVLFSGTT